jgi:hypothetical protein
MLRLLQMPRGAIVKLKTFYLLRFPDSPIPRFRTSLLRFPDSPIPRFRTSLLRFPDSPFPRFRFSPLPRFCSSLTLLLLAGVFSACTSDSPDAPAVPQSMAEVPAAKLAYRFESDVQAPPDEMVTDDPNKKLEAVQKDFDSRRKEDALIRTVLSPDSQRVMALYETGENTPGEFRVDLYTADGTFLRNVTPPDFAGAFAQMAEWAPDGKYIIFGGRKSVTPKPSPTPSKPLSPELFPTPTPTSSVAPLFEAVPLFSTEQIYICDRDGFTLKPLTTREGLIYFSFEWAPDGHSIAALACKEDEWDAQEKEHRTPKGRPRLIDLNANERLLDDDSTEASPTWSPDSTKVAAAFDTDVRVYDAQGEATTQSTIALRDALLNASVRYDKLKLESQDKGNAVKPGDASSAKQGNPSTGPAKAAATPAQSAGAPVSFNPVVKLEWTGDNDLYIKTAFIRVYGTERIVTFQRWHLLHLSPQASLFGQQPPK